MGLPLTRWDAHPFEPGPEPEVCALCGERRVYAKHQPRRVRAALLLRGIDPDAVLDPSGETGSRSNR